MKRQVAFGVGLALTLFLGGCGSSESPEEAQETATASAAPSVTASPSVAPSPSVTASPSPSNPGSGSASVSATELDDPSLAELPADLNLPADVGSYHGESRTVSGLGDGPSMQVEYSDASAHRDMTLLGSSLKEENLEESQPLGQLGVCGYLYGQKNNPMCLMKVEGGHKVVVNGDYQSTLEETRAFTIQLVNLALKSSKGA